MASEAPNMVIEHLRHIRSRVDTISEELRSVNMRMGSIGRHFSGLHSSDVDHSSEIDRLKQRVDRIERRLELGE